MERYSISSERYDNKTFCYIFDNKKQIRVNEKFSCIEKEVVDRYDYLNKYELAKRYKIFQDNNKRYWIFKKSKIEYYPVYDSNGVFYTKLFNQPTNGYSSMKQCLETIKHIEKHNQYTLNAKILKEVKI